MSRACSPPFSFTHGNESPDQSSEVQFDFIHIAPTPIFSWLEGFYDRVRGLLKVLRRVLIFGAVAATHMATFEAQPQVYPGVAHFQTLFAALRSFWLHRPYLIHMTASRHVFLLR